MIIASVDKLVCGQILRPRSVDTFIYDVTNEAKLTEEIKTTFKLIEKRKVKMEYFIIIGDIKALFIASVWVL